MRLQSITIKNTRLIGKVEKHLSIEEDKNVFILLGNNGYGKTTVLDCIANTISPFIAQFPQIPDRQFSDRDVHITEEGRLSSYLSVEAFYSAGNRIMKSYRYRKGIHKAPEADLKEIKLYALELKEAIVSNDENVELPMVAYYGTGRGRIVPPERKRSFQQSFERWDCYKNTLNPATDFKRFFQWFDLMEDEERRERERRWEKGFRLPVLEAVRHAIEEFMAPTYKNPRILTKPLRFAIDNIEQDGSCRELRIEQLSDGYKIILAMVADIASRLAEANPSMPNPLDGSGIILIDEIDLHLHPKWQRTILQQLHSVFKNIQFIVSTHSPIIVVGAADIAQVVNLNKEFEPIEDLSRSNIARVLQEDYFGLPSIFAPKWDEDIKERDLLLSKAVLSEQEEQRLAELDEKLSGISSSLSVSSAQTQTILNKIAEKYDISL